MTSQSEWAADLFAAVDDLGYGVVSLTPGSVTLAAKSHEITITSHFIGGSFLRATLLSARGTVSGPVAVLDIDSRFDRGSIK